MKNVSVNYQSLSGHLAVVKILHDFCLKIHKYKHILWGTKSFKVPQETKHRCKIDIFVLFAKEQACCAKNCRTVVARAGHQLVHEKKTEIILRSSVLCEKYKKALLLPKP